MKINSILPIIILLISSAVLCFKCTDSNKMPGKPGKPSDLPSQSSTNPQEGLTGKQISQDLTKKLAEAGGPLTVWLNNLDSAGNEADLIKNVKLTAKLQGFLSKVERALNEVTPLVHAEGATLEDLVRAKAAYVVFAKEYYFPLPSKAVLCDNIAFFAPNPKSKLRPSDINPNGLEIDVPTDFSRGWAIKLNERDRIMLYEWNFHTNPPADGTGGIETEFE